MEIYKKLNNEIKNIIDLYYYDNHVKPIQDLLITELSVYFIPKCLICKKPLLYINWYGYNEYYLRSHELCIQCYNESEYYYDGTESETDTSYFDYDTTDTMISIDYETDDTIESFDSNLSINTI